MFLKPLSCFFYALLLVSSFSVSAENSQQKQENLQKKISSVNTTLKKSRAVSKTIKKNIRAVEDKLNNISQGLHQTEREINHLTSKLSKSNIYKKKLQKETAEQKQALVRQMQALYSSGKQSHLRLLLKQDDPSDISRTIQYFEYMNKYRIKRIKFIKKRLKKITKLQAQIAKDTESLKKLQATQSKRKKTLKIAVKEKNRLLKKQGKVISSQEKRLSSLRQDESRLKGVLKSLALKQKKEEAEEKSRALKRKLEAKRIQQASKLAKSSKKIAPPIKRRFVPNKAFSSLRGKLSWPVRGRITHKYGSPRNSKINWNGVIIAAPGGTNVHAVARGKVEFSGRLKGYGYVVIIRHDKSYRSLYAYNRSIYKKAGQIVKADEIIAAVGNSGRLANTSLYFEISKGSIQQNPAHWCR